MEFLRAQARNKNPVGKLGPTGHEMAYSLLQKESLTSKKQKINQNPTFK